MIDIIILILVALIVVGIGYWAAGKLGAAFNLPPAVVVVAQVVIVILVLLYVLQRAGWAV